MIPSQNPSLSRCEPQGFEHEAFGVYQQMSLAALDLLAPVVTTLIASHAGALDLPWESTAPALGSGSRFLRTRTRLRKAAWILSQVPSRRQVLK